MASPDLSSIGQVLREAADLLDRDGWIQGCAYEPDGTGKCMVAAICSSPSYNGQLSTIRDLLQDYIGTNNTERWNDAEGRTQFEVTNTLRKLAESL